MPSPKIWAVQFDAETDVALELDRARISGERGITISKSVYLRGIIERYVHGVKAPTEQGWTEGYRAGLAAFRRDETTLLSRLMALRTTEASLNGYTDGSGDEIG